MDEWTIELRGKRVRIERNGEHYHTSQQFEQAASARFLLSMYNLNTDYFGHPFASEQDPNPTRPAEPEPKP